MAVLCFSFERMQVCFLTTRCNTFLSVAYSALEGGLHLVNSLYLHMWWNSSVRIVPELWVVRPENRDSILCGGRDFSFHHRVHTGCRGHPAFYPMSTGVPFPGVKWRGREAERLFPSNAEVKNA